MDEPGSPPPKERLGHRATNQQRERCAALLGEEVSVRLGPSDPAIDGVESIEHPNCLPPVKGAQAPTAPAAGQRGESRQARRASGGSSRQARSGVARAASTNRLHTSTIGEMLR